jgi:hypothetical protein
MLSGRLIFGIGSETLEVGQADILNVWFGSHHLSFAMGLSVSLQRAITTTMFNVAPSLVSKTSVPFVFKVGLVVCICGFLSSVLLCYLNQFAPKDISTPMDPDFDIRNQESISDHDDTLSNASTIQNRFVDYEKMMESPQLSPIPESSHHSPNQPVPIFFQSNSDTTSSKNSLVLLCSPSSVHSRGSN